MTALLALSLAQSGYFRGSYREPKPPKNKLGLTEYELEQMETMTPKEKKQFLRSRANDQV